MTQCSLSSTIFGSKNFMLTLENSGSLAVAHSSTIFFIMALTPMRVLQVSSKSVRARDGTGCLKQPGSSTQAFLSCPGSGSSSTGGTTNKTE